MTTTSPSTKDRIVEAGSSSIAAKSFNGCGLKEILDLADVPKGSFYHYFKSKERFGQALLEDYFTDYLAGLDTLMQTPGLSGRDRLLRYFEQWRTTQADDCDEQKCLVVKLSADIAMQLDVDDALRGHVFAVQDSLFWTAFVVAVTASAAFMPADGHAPGLIVAAAAIYLAGLAGHALSAPRTR